MQNNPNGGNVYNVCLSAQTLTTQAGGWDLVTITANSSSRLEIARIDVTIQSSQTATYPGMGLQLLTGSTGVSTGAAITPAPVKRYSGAKAADFTATGPSTTVSSTASATLIYAGACAPDQFLYEPAWDARPLLGLSGKFTLRTTTLQTAATVVSLTVTCQEAGKGLPS